MASAKPWKRPSSKEEKEFDSKSKKRKESSHSKNKDPEKKSAKKKFKDKESKLKIQSVSELAALVTSGAIQFPRSLTHYMKDPAILLDQVFAILSQEDVKGMLPDILKGLKVKRVRQLCYEQLQGMSNEQISNVITNPDPTPPAITESSRDEDVIVDKPEAMEVELISSASEKGGDDLNNISAEIAEKNASGEKEKDSESFPFCGNKDVSGSTRKFKDSETVTGPLPGSSVKEEKEGGGLRESPGNLGEESTIEHRREETKKQNFTKEKQLIEMEEDRKDVDQKIEVVEQEARRHDSVEERQEVVIKKRRFTEEKDVKRVEGERRKVDQKIEQETKRDDRAEERQEVRRRREICLAEEAEQSQVKGKDERRPEKELKAIVLGDALTIVAVAGKKDKGQSASEKSAAKEVEERTELRSESYSRTEQRTTEGDQNQLCISVADLGLDIPQGTADAGKLLEMELRRKALESKLRRSEEKSCGQEMEQERILKSMCNEKEAEKATSVVENKCIVDRRDTIPEDPCEDFISLHPQYDGEGSEEVGEEGIETSGHDEQNITDLTDFLEERLRRRALESMFAKRKAKEKLHH